MPEMDPRPADKAASRLLQVLTPVPQREFLLIPATIVRKLQLLLSNHKFPLPFVWHFPPSAFSIRGFQLIGTTRGCRHQCQLLWRGMCDPCKSANLSCRRDNLALNLNKIPGARSEGRRGG